MIEYIVTCDGLPLLDAQTDDLLESGVLDRKITDGLFEGEFSFTILPDHRYFSAIHPKKSVIRVTDNGKEIFRGDVIPGKRDRTRRTQLTCQSDMKWLADVPDVFSMAGKTAEKTKAPVSEMFEAVFCKDDADTMTGYNAYATPERRIYRGDCELDAVLDYSTPASCYANLKRWVKEAGGYAKITKNSATGLYYIHLMKTSGQMNDSYRVQVCENVIDCGETFSCGSLATGIYPVGTDGSTRVALEGEGAISGKSGFSVSQQAVWCDNAVSQYGKILRYREYPVSNVPAAQRQQYLREKAADDLTSEIRASVTYEIPSVDPRLTGGEGSGQELGDYYPVDVPLLEEPQYLQLSRIVTNLMKPSVGKQFYGDDKAQISGVMKAVASAQAKASAAQETANQAKNVADAAATPAQVAEAIAQSEGRIADYVVETGADEIWAWQKWASGKAECWGVSKLSVSANGWNGSGSTYYINGSEAFPAGLFTDAPELWVHPGNDNLGGNLFIYAAKHEPVTAATAKYRLMRSSNFGQAVTIDVNLHAIGIWK